MAAIQPGLADSNVPELSGDMSTATAVAGAVTMTSQLCVITSEALVTAAAADYTLTITTARTTAGAAAFVTIGNGTNTTAPNFAHSVAVTAGQIVVKVRNGHASAALNGTITITVLVV